MANIFNDDFDIKYYTQLIAEALMNDADIYNAICEMHNSGIKLRNTITKKLPYTLSNSIFTKNINNAISNILTSTQPHHSEPMAKTDTATTDTQKKTISAAPQQKNETTYSKHRKRITEWSKSSDTSLRNALSNRKTKNKPIEPELHAELVKRFPNYNPETKTFAHSKHRKRITEWSKSSDMSLRHTFANRKKAGKAIEPELLAELIKRFPNFDSKEQTFIRKKRNNKPVITTHQTKQPATTKTLIPQQEAHTTTDTVKKTPDDTQPVSTAIPTTSDTSAQQQNQTPVNVDN